MQLSCNVLWCVQSMLAIMKLVAAIMHLGNVKFKSQVQRKLGCDVDGCAVTTKPALEVACPPVS